MVKCQTLVDHVYAVFHFGSEKLVMDHTDDGKDQRMGNQDNVTSIPLQETQRRNVGQLPYKNVQYYSVQNHFERFRGFLELISRFEFEFCRCEFVF